MYESLSAESRGSDSEGKPEEYDTTISGHHQLITEPTEASQEKEVRNQTHNERVMDPLLIIRGHGKVDPQEVGQDDEGDPIIDGELLSTHPELPLREQIRRANEAGAADLGQKDIYDLLEQAKVKKRRGKLTESEENDIKQLLAIIKVSNSKRQTHGIDDNELDFRALHQNVPHEEIGTDSEDEPIYYDEEDIKKTTATKTMTKLPPHQHDEL